MFVKEITPERKEALRRSQTLIQSCTRFLAGHGPLSVEGALEQLLTYSRNHTIDNDWYGMGEFLNGFESEMAELLGFEAAVFLPSGVMAQNIALRIWTDRVRNPHVAFHATSHMEVNEEHAYRHLHGLRATLLGEPHRPTVARDLLAMSEMPAALLLELPARRIGGQLPTWRELEELKATCRSRGVRLHLDGARLWECSPGYGKSWKEICTGFDSVYVSFYKGIGNNAGSMLLGSADFIREARVWQRRHGGTLVQIYPFVVSAKQNFEWRNDKFDAYAKRARELAAALKGIPEIATIVPEPPQVNMFHIHFRKPIAALAQGRERVAERHKFWLSGYLFETKDPETTGFEVTAGDATLLLDLPEVVEMFREWMRLS